MHTIVLSIRRLSARDPKNYYYYYYKQSCHEYDAKSSLLNYHHPKEGRNRRIILDHQSNIMIILSFDPPINDTHPLET